MLQKGFLTQQNVFKVSRRRFWWAVFVGLFSSIGIYTLLSFLRLSFRIFDSAYGHSAIIINDTERYWQNFYFALIAFTIGNSLFLVQLFKKPFQSTLKSYKRGQIINNQLFLSFGFFYWFFKLFHLVLFLAIGYMGTSFLKPYQYLLFLIPVVLFLESWKAILLTFRKKAYLPIFYCAFAITVFSFSLANTSIFNVNGIDKMLQKVNPKVSLPEASFQSKATNTHYEYLKIILLEGSYVYYIDGFKTDLDGLAVYLADEERGRPELYGRSTVLLLAPANSTIQQIKKVETLLFFYQRRKIGYLVSRPNEELSRFENRYIYQNRPLTNKNLERFKERYKALLTKEALSMPLPPEIEAADYNIKDVLVSQNGFSIGNLPVSEEDLVEEFIRSIDNKTYFNFLLFKDTSYQNYITVLSSYLQALEDLRANEAMVVPVYKNIFDIHPINKKAYEEDQKRVRKIYPFLKVENYSF